MTQNEQIKSHLEAGNRLTALQALKLFGCLRLSGRVYDLKNRFDLPVESAIIEVNGKHVAEYFLPAENVKPKSATLCT